MKTVIDAVNEFKGDFDNGNFANTHNDNFLINDDYVHMIVTNQNCDLEVGTLVVYSEVDERDDVDFICTRKQFNDLVSQMETNFGKCDPVLAAYYRHVTDKELLTKSTKELKVMDIDWSKAPEGATHYAGESEDDVACWIKQDPDHGLSYVAVWLHEQRGKDAVVHWISPGDFILIDCVAKPQPPVYTQAMADNGELPSVGMECELSEGFNGFDKGSILKVYSHDVSSNDSCVLAGALIKDVSGGVQAFEFHIKYLKPLAPPIKLIDGECYQGIHKGSGKLYKGVYVKSTDEIFHCKCSNPASFYTNIKPLIVEVK